jgi:hypothetical protein
MAVKMSLLGFWVVSICGITDEYYQWSAGIYWLYLQGGSMFI